MATLVEYGPHPKAFSALSLKLYVVPAVIELDCKKLRAVEGVAKPTRGVQVPVP